MSPVTSNVPEELRKYVAAAVWMPFDKLEPWANNPRDNRKAIDKVALSIERFGFVAPICIWTSHSRMVAGHTRFAAFKQLLKKNPDFVPPGAPGVGLVPVRFHEFPSEKAADAYAIADNKLGELATWNDDLLASVLDTLRDEQPLFEATGFDFASHFSESDAEESEDTVTQVSAKLRKKWGTAGGQVWNIPGSRSGIVHRLGIGDSTKSQDVARVMAGKKADLLFTSPPYNVGIAYASHDDEQVPWSEYRSFLKAILEAWLPAVAQRRVVAWNIGSSPKTYPAHQHILLEEVGLTYFRQMIWKKTGVPFPIWHTSEKAKTARVFHPNYTHELVYLFTKGALEKGGPTEPDDLLANDVFELSPLTVDLPRGAAGDAKGPNAGSQPVHPATFPIRLPLAFIQNLSDEGSIVVDPFMGSGTTMIAADQAGRCGHGLELDPGYAAVVLERFEKRGLKAKLVG